VLLALLLRALLYHPEEGKTVFLQNAEYGSYLFPQLKEIVE